MEAPLQWTNEDGVAAFQYQCKFGPPSSPRDSSHGGAATFQYQCKFGPPSPCPPRPPRPLPPLVVPVVHPGRSIDQEMMMMMMMMMMHKSSDNEFADAIRCHAFFVEREWVPNRGQTLGDVITGVMAQLLALLTHVHVPCSDDGSGLVQEYNAVLFELFSRGLACWFTVAHATANLYSILTASRGVRVRSVRIKYLFVQLVRLAFVAVSDIESDQRETGLEFVNCVNAIRSKYDGITSSQISLLASNRDQLRIFRALDYRMLRLDDGPLVKTVGGHFFFVLERAAAAAAGLLPTVVDYIREPSREMLDMWTSLGKQVVPKKK